MTLGTVQCPGCLYSGALHLENCLDERIKFDVRSSVPVKRLLDIFLSLLNDIGQLGVQKYVLDSFYAKVERGEGRGDNVRLSTSAIMSHMAKHAYAYQAGEPHDVFKTVEHQLAAVAFNAMMEIYFRQMDKESPDATNR